MLTRQLETTHTNSIRVFKFLVKTMSVQAGRRQRRWGRVLEGVVLKVLMSSLLSVWFCICSGSLLWTYQRGDEEA